MSELQREAKYYTASYEGDDPQKAPFYLRSLVFDGKEGDLNTELVDGFNHCLAKDPEFRDVCLVTGPVSGDVLPERIVVVNASHDNLPTSYETARIFEDRCRERGWKIPAVVVNTREELLKEIGEDPEKVLLMSQCVDKKVYNAALAEELEDAGVVTVPGKVTAPGGVFSDKNRTYELLSDGGTRWDDVARYIKVDPEGKSVEEVVGGIFEAVDRLAEETGDDTFFVKPHEGGGGLGGFRITRHAGGYIIPDLSKVSGDDETVHPTFIDIDFEDKDKLREILWIYRLFSSDEKMELNYILADIPLEGVDDEAALVVLRDYLSGSSEERSQRLAAMMISPKEAVSKLVDAIKIFEKKFSRQYTPLVNEHLDFGLWGLRAHYRLTREGPRLETMYSRVFQLAFTPEGIGYVGSDNISNKQTGQLEILRLGPVNSFMVNALGGKDELYAALAKGADALVKLAALVPEKDRGHIPLRLQIDLAAPSKRIGEGNADTARGLCLASRWTEFVRNAREWIDDSIAYYSWKKGER